MKSKKLLKLKLDEFSFKKVLSWNTFPFISVEYPFD